MMFDEGEEPPQLIQTVLTSFDREILVDILVAGMIMGETHIVDCFDSYLDMINVYPPDVEERKRNAAAAAMMKLLEISDGPRTTHMDVDEFNARRKSHWEFMERLVKDVRNSNLDVSYCPTGILAMAATRAKEEGAGEDLDTKGRSDAPNED